MMFGGMYSGMGWIHIIGAVIIALVIAELIRYVFFQ